MSLPCRKLLGGWVLVGAYGTHREVGRCRGGQPLVGRRQGLRRRWVLVRGFGELVGVRRVLVRGFGELAGVRRVLVVRRWLLGRRCLGRRKLAGGMGRRRLERRKLSGGVGIAKGRSNLMGASPS